MKLDELKGELDAATVTELNDLVSELSERLTAIERILIRTIDGITG